MHGKSLLLLCETPKSPPGDYNDCRANRAFQLSVERDRVKHLNPRQGITTFVDPVAIRRDRKARVKHLNPRQGITTAGRVADDGIEVDRGCETPKSPPGDYN